MNKMSATKRGRPKLSSSDKKLQVTFYVPTQKLIKFGCGVRGTRASNTDKLIDYLNQMIDLYSN